MSRLLYFNYIEDKLNILATRINSRGRLNILDIHNHSETFYQYFLMELYGWDVINENEKKLNVEAIDLIDHTNKLVIQVSATNTKQKIESSLSKDLIKKLRSYTFKFVSISKDSDNLRKDSFKNPHRIKFNPISDIIDKNSILSYIKGLKIDEQEKIFLFIKKELGGEIDIAKLQSNLAVIVNILSKEDWDRKDPLKKLKPLRFRKIKMNDLHAAASIINDYSNHYGKLNKIYNEFDLQGFNKSKSVLSAISKEYLKARTNF